MTRPQIITLELEDCSEALVEYVENIERTCRYEPDIAEQALQSRKELAARAVESFASFILNSIRWDLTEKAKHYANKIESGEVKI